MKRYLSILLTVLVLISVFSVSSFAASGNLDFNAYDLPYFAEYYDTQSGNYVNLSVSKNLETLSGVQVVKYVVERITQGVSNTRFCNVYKVGNLKANHEYSLSFSYAYTQSSSATFRVYLQVLNGNGTVIDSQNIYALSGAASNQLQQVNVNFVPDLTNVTQGYTMRLLFEFSQANNLYPYTCYISNNVYFNDNDDESAWFESIINWLQNVRDSVSNGFSNLGSSLSSLGSNISTWLTSVKDGIVNKLSDVITGINNKLETVKTYISDKIDGIQQWFINLGNSIGEFFTMLKNYILYFKHPVTLNPDGVPVDSSGNPVYVNPFESALDSVEETITEWIDNVNDFIDSIDESAETVSEPLQLFKTAFTRFGNGAPFFIGIIVFAVVFFVIRKVVGR